MNLVIDTNIWVSGVIWRGSTPRRLMDLLDKPEAPYKVLIDEWLYSEIAETLNEMTEKYRISPDDLKEFLKRLKIMAVWVKVTSVVHKSRDIFDNPILALAKDGHANYLVTGDKDLLVLEKFGKTDIITAREMIKLLKWSYY